MKHWVHLKCSQITTKDYNNSWYCTLHSTFKHRTQTNTTSSKNFLKVLQLNANGIHNKKDEIELLMKNTQADVIAMQESKLKSIPQNTKHSSVYTYHNKPHSQTRKRPPNLH